MTSTTSQLDQIILIAAEQGRASIEVKKEFLSIPQDQIDSLNDRGFICEETSTSYIIQWCKQPRTIYDF